VIDAEITRSHAPSAADEQATESLFVFSVEGSWIAVRASHVERVLEQGACSSIPGAPAHVLGVIADGDQVLPVMDLATLCALPARRAPADFGRIVVVSDGPLVVGVRAEAAAGVLEVEAANVRSPTVSSTGALAAFVDGEVDSPWGLCAIINLPILFEAARVR